MFRRREKSLKKRRLKKKKSPHKVINRGHFICFQFLNKIRFPTWVFCIQYKVKAPKRGGGGVGSGKRGAVFVPTMRVSEIDSCVYGTRAEGGWLRRGAMVSEGMAVFVIP